MRVFFDYQAFEIQRIGGVSRLYAEIIPRLRKADVDCIVGVKESDNVYLREKELVQGIKPLYYRHNMLFGGKKLFKGQRLLTRKALEWYGYHNDCKQVNKDYCIGLLKKQHFDVFEPTFFDSYFVPYLKSKPFAMEVHDMIPELFPQYFSRNDFQIVQKKKLCQLAAYVHVPSMKTKEDLVNILNVLPEKVIVISRGSPFCDNNSNVVSSFYDFPYILFVGERGGYKNFSGFLRECTHIVKRYPDIRIVCTGKGFNNEEEREIADLKMGERVIHHYADQDSLRTLYHYAIAFVYPSAYEGFGLPILESFSNDCPVMLNDASCFPEIAGDAAIYFDIKKDGDLYEKFVAFYQSGANDRRAMIEKGRLRVQQYSWERTAESVKNIYQAII